MAGSMQIKSFAGGMNKDASYSALPENAYIHAENFKLITEDGGTGFTLENAEGNSVFIDLGNLIGVFSNDYIVGTCFVKPYLIVFTSTAKTNLEPEDADAITSKIIRFVIDKDVVQDYDVIYKDSATLGYLNLSVTNPIKAVGYYESNEVVKVYWTDGYNEVRFLNIVGSDIDEMTADQFSLVPDFPDLSGLEKDTRVVFDSLVTGRLKASTVQYTYQYYRKNGASTKFAPLSAPVIIPFTSDTVNYIKYRGGEAEEVTGNGCRLKINVPATKQYDRIRLVALDFYGSLDVPVVRVFKEVQLDTSDTTTEYYFTDIGETVNEMVYEDFLVYGETIYSAKDLEAKDSMLFLGNIEETGFDVDFDARAYRFDSDGWAVVYDSALNVESGITTFTWDGIPETRDCINIFNSPDHDDDTDNWYMYQSDEETLGAEGPNVKIGFKYEANTIDTTPLSNVVNPTPTTGEAMSYTEKATYSRSLQRDEVYRLGVVFFNEKMQPSKVKWSCDLKTPNNYDTAAFLDWEGYVVGPITIPASVQAISMGIEVTLKSTMPDGAYAWQVVMVPRRFDDRSVLFNGVMQTPIVPNGLYGATAHHPDSDETLSSGETGSLTTMSALDTSMTDHEQKLAVLISPEINFNQNIVYQSGDFLQYVGYYKYAEGTYDSSNDVSLTYQAKLGPFEGTGEKDDAGHRKNIVAFEIVPQNADTTAEVQVGNFTYNNYARSADSPATYVGLHGTCGVAELEEELVPDTYFVGGVPAFSYRRNVFTSQYGGIDYYSRLNSEYIGIGEIQYDTGSTGAIFEGDTYIDYFWYLKQAKDLTDSDSWYGSLLFPVESSIASSLQHSKTHMQIRSVPSFLMREVSGIHTGEVGSGGEYTFEQEKDLYQYDSVYSIPGLGKKYFSSLFDESNVEYFPIRIRNSDIKVNGEIQDSFTIFRANNFIDVEGKYGEINNLETFKNSLFYWQDSGFGVVSVNERSLIQDNNPGMLALGSGGVLDRYDYISNTTGNVNENGIVKTNTGLYWVDNNKNEFIRFKGGEQSVSKLLGVQSWINNTGNIGHVIGAYDYKYNDVIFTVTFSDELVKNGVSGNYTTSLTFVGHTDLSGEYNVKIDGRFDGRNTRRNVAEIANPNNGGVTLERNPYVKLNRVDGVFYTTILKPGDKTYTISLNEQIDKFVSYHSFEPLAYIQCDKEYMSIPEELNMIYHHNDKDASRCNYYGIVYDSVITTVFNKDYPYTKVFDNIKWVSESKDSNGINQFKDTFSEMSLYNDYQHVGDRTLYYQHDTATGTYPTPISRRERTWSLQVPRNIVDQSVENNPDIMDDDNWDATQEFKERMRDKYLIGKFVYDNTDGNMFSIPFISTTFRRSFR